MFDSDGHKVLKTVHLNYHQLNMLFWRRSLKQVSCFSRLRAVNLMSKLEKKPFSCLTIKSHLFICSVIVQRKFKVIFFLLFDNLTGTEATSFLEMWQLMKLLNRGFNMWASLQQVVVPFQNVDLTFLRGPLLSNLYICRYICSHD